MNIYSVCTHTINTDSIFLRVHKYKAHALYKRFRLSFRRILILNLINFVTFEMRTNEFITQVLNQ